MMYDGYWEHHKTKWVSCSVCQTSFPITDRFDLVNYCPYCGKRLARYIQDYCKALQEDNRMTKKEAIYCMTTYLPDSDHSVYDCPKCKHYKNGCESSEAHKLAIKALKNENALLDRVLEIIDKEIQLAQDCQISTVTLWRVREEVWGLKYGE